MTLRKATMAMGGVYTDVILRDQNGTHKETITFSNTDYVALIIGQEVQVELKKVKG